MTDSKWWTLVVTGYSILMVGMLAFLTINAVTTGAVGPITTGGPLVVGFLLATAGMVQLARSKAHGFARTGLVLESVSLIGLLIGLAMSFIASSLSGHLVSAVFIVPAGVLGMLGALFISKEARVRPFVIGAALIAIGAALIPASNIAQLEYLMLSVDKDVYQDIGATIAACGCVVAAYSFLVLRSRADVHEGRI